MNMIVEEGVNKYSKMVLQIAYQRSFNMLDVENIAQEFFIRVIDNQEKIQSEEHLKAWLIRVASNLCNDYNKSFGNRNIEELVENEIVSLPGNDYKRNE